MRPFQGVRRMFAAKSSAVGGLGETRSAWLTTPGAARWTGRRYDRFAEEGYRRNVIAHRCVRLVAEGAASMSWLLYDGERELTDHPVLTLLRRPNPLDAGTSLLENLYGYLQIAGNAYLEAVENAQAHVAELYALRPDRMTVVPGSKGWPRGYKYSVGGQSHLFEHDPARGVAPILHLKAFHPLDDHYGLSAFEPAAYGIDLHNEASAWNKALLDNAARPSGALVYDPGEKGGTLTEAQFDRLKEEMEAQYQGGRNAGRPLLLEGGLSWQQLGFSPADMDFINAKHVSAREIALAFGVPPMLLGIPGDNTYANYAEANRALWRQTILPMAGKLAAALNAWLTPRFGEELRLDFDTDAVDALTFDRAQTWAQVGAAAFLTLNEKRSALGYGPIAGGDVLQPVVAAPFVSKGLDMKGVREERAARYADLLKEHELAVDAGSTTKTWKTAGDGEVRHSHTAMEGVTILIGEAFEVGGETLFLPGDPSASLDETANCRCYVAYGVGERTIPESEVGGIRAEKVARALTSLGQKYGVELNDTYRNYSTEDRRKLFGRKLTEDELVGNIEDLESELDRIKARGTDRGKDWALAGTRDAYIADREHLAGNLLGRVSTLRYMDGQTARTITFNPKFTESDIQRMTASIDPIFAPYSMFSRETGQTSDAAKRYVIRHEVGHALQAVSGEVDPNIGRLYSSARRKLSYYAGSDKAELVAELFAWYTSADYDGSLPSEVEAALDDLLR